MKTVLLSLALGVPVLSIAAMKNTVTRPDSTGNELYRSVGKLNGELQCTASYIATSDNSNASAYLLTNGHCAQSLEHEATNSVTVNKNVNYIATLNYFHDSKGQTIPVNVTSVSYATMKGMDLAILKTDKTIGEMNALDLTPLKLSTSTPFEGEDISVVGVPMNVNALQLSTCNNGKPQNVVEYFWHWYNTQENDCLGIAPGSSGSPVLNASNEIIGVVNTTNVDRVGETCYSSNPCIVTVTGTTINSDRNYAIPVTDLNSCFSENGEFSLSAENCPLPAPSKITISDYPFIVTGKNSANQKWDFTINTELESVRIKKIAVNSNNMCNDITGYSDPVAVSSLDIRNESIDVSAPDGAYQYCIIPGDDTNAEDPTVVQVLIDNTPSTFRPVILLDQIGTDMLYIQPRYTIPEVANLYVSIGAPDSTDCSTATYTRFDGMPYFMPLEPTKVCVYGLDMADNRGESVEYFYPTKDSGR